MAEEQGWLMVPESSQALAAAKAMEQDDGSTEFEEKQTPESSEGQLKSWHIAAIILLIAFGLLFACSMLDSQFGFLKALAAY